MPGIKLKAKINAISSKTKGILLEYDTKKWGHKESWHDVKEPAAKILPNLKVGQEIVVVLGPETDRKGRPLVTYISQDVDNFVPKVKVGEEETEEETSREETTQQEEANFRLIEDNSMDVWNAIKLAAGIVELKRTEQGIDLDKYRQELRMVARTILEIFLDLKDMDNEEWILPIEEAEKDEDIQEDNSGTPQEEPIYMDDSSTDIQETQDSTQHY